ncbi:DOMON-like domain-containing protein [Candidatus Thiothrix sp. Deng01]|uniref:DOMON-like domain-containing protein n=1 Tax=Candidatus Thiothrix phosphatis TaxID=3112415 RepID=A0ABU6CV03_9GAMM|nr:DOMON-like domain-containing protein [Candidatus Thiothrix sp. Deng01]MEB4590667.1 DOMON-like domain-containing protein [Candidatus Thiothrix sp. Deng01]
MLLLSCHPATPCAALHSLHATAEHIPESGLRLRYVLNGDLARILLPPPQAPVAADGLWEHTCFEAFISVQGENGYREFNFSPSSQWAAYAFSDYRQRLEWVANHAPEVKFSLAPEDGKDGDRLQLDAFIAAADLPVNPDGKALVLGLTAVIETTTGEKSYWALKHPTGRPDFHQRNGFIHEIWP